jgi:hypothetical protein
LDVSKIRTRSARGNSCEYLYVICEKDYMTKVEIEKACEMLKMRKYDVKDVKVDQYTPGDADMMIIKRGRNIS